MTNDEFQRLAALYGFAPSRALREVVDAAVAAERERIKAANAPVIENINRHLRHLNELLAEIHAIRARSKE